MEKARDKYRLAVMEYTLVDENNDGVYEPNSKLFVRNLTCVPLSVPAESLIHGSCVDLTVSATLVASPAHLALLSSSITPTLSDA